MPRLDALIEGYLAYKADVSRTAPGTIRDIRCSLSRVARHMRELKPQVSLWHLKLEDFLQWIEVERQSGTSPASLAKYLTHVRCFLEYAWRSGRTERNVLDGLRLQDDSPRTAPRSLTIEEARQLIAACAQTTAQGRRDRLMVLLLYGCGLRTHELCALNLRDVSTERRELSVLTAKGDKPRSVPVPDAVFTELLAYLHERGGKRGPLFRTLARKKRIRVKDVGEVVRHAVRRAGLSGDITPKALRHSFATHLMDRGVDLGVIASLMGHRSPHETGVYLHVLPDRKEAAVTKISRGA